MRSVSFILLLLLYSFGNKEKVKTLNPLASHPVKMREPSDICTGTSSDKLFILGDKAFVYETDNNGNILRKSSFEGYDLEGICTDDKFIYVSEESFRLVHKLDKQTLALVKTYQIEYHGARNLGFESITYNERKHLFVMATEKDPQLIREYDSDFKQVNQFSIPEINEVSALTWYNGNIWLLSDEGMEVFKLDADSYEIKGRWKIPVINPEGICFQNNGDMIITSDDMGKIFYFKNPETN